jgi:ABC-2 type transport system permease protein
MSKYFTIGYISLKEYFVYRINFVLWRLRNVFMLILTYYLWSSVYTTKVTLFGYTREEIITYVLAVTLVSTFVLAGRTADLAGEILNGSIINYLLKPFNFLWGIVVREAADKFVNIGFSVIEVVVLILILKPYIIVSTSFTLYFWLIFLIGIGSVISFFISFLLSMLAFWTPEVWGPRFIFMILTTFLSGMLYPLDIFSPVIYNVLMLTPFPYLGYVQAKLFVKGIEFITPQLIISSLIWTVILYLLVKFMWQKGMKEFSFYGR